MASITRSKFRLFSKSYQYILKCSNNFRNNQNVLFHATSYLNVKGQPINMPSLSPTMSEGTIVKWLKKEGEKVQPGDVLCDIQTDKAIVSMETDEEGILAKILVHEDAKDVKVGTLIALMVADDEDWKSVEVPSSETQQSTSLQSNTETSSPTGSANVSGPPTTSLNMPSLSPTMTEGTIVKWFKKEGDVIAPGDALCDIQTDKAVVTMDTEEEGILAKIIVAENTSNVKVGTLIGLIVAEGEDWKNVTVSTATTSESKPTAPDVASTTTTSTAPQISVLIGPASRNLLELYQIDVNDITGSGRNNRILKEDVLNYIVSKKLKPKPPKTVSAPGADLVKQPSPAQVLKLPIKSGAKYTDFPVSNMRQIIAKRLSQSKREIPHAYGNIKCNIDKLLEVRQSLITSGVKVSVNDIIIRAVASALRECPNINVLFTKNGITPVQNVDISIAVATDSGLITPIIKNADQKTIQDISSTVKELSAKARSNTLKPDEFQGGSFTISNLGMFGIKEFSAIINPPQTAILAVGGGLQSMSINLKPRSDLVATLSYDRRAIQEDDAARFLEAVRVYIETPNRLVTGSEQIAVSMSL